MKVSRRRGDGVRALPAQRRRVREPGAAELRAVSQPSKFPLSGKEDVAAPPSWKDVGQPALSTLSARLGLVRFLRKPFGFGLKSAGGHDIVITVEKRAYGLLFALRPLANCGSAVFRLR